jgi:SAM-dependent methyltransferase
MELNDVKRQAVDTWSAGDFDALSKRILAVGTDLVDRVEVSGGEKLLDVACGTGNATIPAAQAGAEATGLDITPKLLEDARRNAEAAGVEIDWIEGDAEALPFDDGSFDVVLSTFGCMFAPDQKQAAAEIARVLRPGGRFGVAAWMPQGNIGRFFLTMAQFMPPPPEGFQPPSLWGLQDHVSGLFEGTGVDLEFAPTAVEFKFASIDEAFDEYATKFGPVVMLREATEADGRWPEVEAAMKGLYADINHSDGDDFRMNAEYLVTQGTKAG